MPAVGYVFVCCCTTDWGYTAARNGRSTAEVVILIPFSGITKGLGLNIEGTAGLILLPSHDKDERGVSHMR